MRVFVGADYRGFELKQAVLEGLAGMGSEAAASESGEALGAETGADGRFVGGLEVEDLGTYDPEQKEDFNGPAVAVAKVVREDRGARGILICGSAHGMCIQANRFKGVRAANCDSVEAARLAREHDDANVLCLSAHFVAPEATLEIVRAFLETEFTPIERRVRRINKLDERYDYEDI